MVPQTQPQALFLSIFSVDLRLYHRSEQNFVNLITNSRLFCAVHRHKLCVFISITWQRLVTASRVRTTNNGIVIVIIVVVYASAATSRQSHGRSFVSSSYANAVSCSRGSSADWSDSRCFFYATDAKRARPDRDGCGLAGRSTRLFRLEINTAVDAPLLRRSLLK